MKNFRLPLIIIVSLMIFSVGVSFSLDKPLKDNKKSVRIDEPDVMPACDLSQLQKSIVYPEKARKQGVEGKVMLKVLVGADGKVKNIKVIHSDSKLLNNAAKKAVKHTTFTSAKKGDRNVKAWVVLPVVFRLN